VTDKQTDAEFVDRVRRALDDGAERLDPGVLSRLNRIRHQAMDAAGSPEARKTRWGFLKPAGVVAALCLILAIGLWGQRGAVPPQWAGPENVEIWAEADEFELYEDLEFYTWLAQVREDAG
jgi:hypothetical protein